MIKFFICLCILNFSNLQILFGCTFPSTQFCESVDKLPNHTIVAGQITKLDNNGIDLEIIRVLRGNESRSNIRIWDRPNWECNGIFPMSAEYFVEENDTIIIMVPMIKGIQNEWDVIGDYRWPEIHFHNSLLEVKNKEVYKGAIEQPWNTYYPIVFDFLFFIDSWINDRSCERVVHNEEVSEKQKVFINPNPAKDMINIIGLKGSAIREYTIFNIAGKQIFIDNAHKRNNQIPISHLSPGIYFIKIKETNQTLKFIKI